MTNNGVSNKRKIIIVFFTFFIIFFLIQILHPGLYCPDSYYHIKRAYLLRADGFLGSMPWMQFSIVRDKSIDIAFLFWLLLIPFTFGSLILGAKIATAIFAGVFFSLFSWLLLKWNIKKPYLWLILLFFSSPSFILRLSLTRPHILAVSLFILTIYFSLKHQYIYLFILGIFYTLAYEVFLCMELLSFLYF